MSGASYLLARADIERIAAALRARPGSQVTSDDSPRLAAVALVLRPRTDEELEVLLIRRAEYEGDPWSGHVAFPGGRHEPGDRSLEETAIRETREETGIDLTRDGLLLGTLDELRPRGNVLPPIVVRPYVFVALPAVTVEPSDEVAEAFWVPLRVLCDPVTSREALVVVRGEPRRVPSFLYEGHTIWGLTERALRQFVSFVLES